MRKILSDDAMRAAKKQVMYKFKTLREVIQEISEQRQSFSDAEIREIWCPFEPYLQMEFEELPLDLETHTRWIVRKIVNWTGGNTNSASEETIIEVAEEMFFNLIQRFKDENLP